MLTLDITTYKEGLYEEELHPSAESLELDSDGFRDITVHARIDCQRRRLLVTLIVEAVAKLECDRTLRPYDEQLAGEYTVLFAPPDFAGAEEREGVYEEVRPLQDNDYEIDVTDIVRDTLVLAIPTRCISPEAREMELQTTYGAPEKESEKDVRPEWEPLKQLLPDESSDNGSETT